jgi:hypothetical protein
MLRDSTVVAQNAFDVFSTRCMIPFVLLLASPVICSWHFSDLERCAILLWVIGNYIG